MSELKKKRARSGAHNLALPAAAFRRAHKPPTTHCPRANKRYTETGSRAGEGEPNAGTRRWGGGLSPERRKRNNRWEGGVLVGVKKRVEKSREPTYTCSFKWSMVSWPEREKKTRRPGEDTVRLVFDRTRYWIEPTQLAARLVHASDRLLQHRLRRWASAMPLTI